jgi:hypothetical protein
MAVFIFAVLVVLFGQLFAYLYTGPWVCEFEFLIACSASLSSKTCCDSSSQSYMVSHGTGYHLSGTGLGADLFGVFHFNATAFIDTRFLGVHQYTSRTGRYMKKLRTFCVAPIVASLQQRQAIYWAVAYDWYGAIQT